MTETKCVRKLMRSYRLLPVTPTEADALRAKFLAANPDIQKAWEIYRGKK